MASKHMKKVQALAAAILLTGLAGCGEPESAECVEAKEKHEEIWDTFVELCVDDFRSIDNCGGLATRSMELRREVEEICQIPEDKRKEPWEGSPY